MRGRVRVAVLVVAVLPALLLARGASAAKVVYHETVSEAKPVQVTFTARKAASFSVVLRVPTSGRTRLYLLGKTAPKGGPLIDTKTYACQGAGGSFTCKGAYDPLPQGTYTFRIVWNGQAAAAVALTAKW